MAGIEDFIKRKNEFKKSHEGLISEPRLITFDGPDGVGKTEISKKVIGFLKEKLIRNGKSPDDIIYFKYTSLIDTESQKNLDKNIRKCKDEKTGSWDQEKIIHILKLFSAKLNRSYNDHILPLIKQGKIVILDRSEIDLLRSGLEWGDQNFLDKIIEYIKNGTITHGITAGNRIFVSSSPNDTFKNLSERKDPLSPNDPKSPEEAMIRHENQKKAEKLFTETFNQKGVQTIKIENRRVENEEEKNAQLDKIAKEIIDKLKI